MRYYGNNICLDTQMNEKTNAVDGQTKNITAG